MTYLKKVPQRRQKAQFFDLRILIPNIEVSELHCSQCAEGHDEIRKAVS